MPLIPRNEMLCSDTIGNFMDGTDMTNWHKSVDGFTRLGTSLEAPFADLRTYLTPTEQFFVCNAGQSLAVDPSTYRLKIKGDAVEKVITLTLGDLAALPQHTVDAYIECAGNQRTLFEKLGQAGIARESTGDDVKWTLGAVAMARWSGPRLRDVLALAGLHDDAAWVAPMGLDVLNPECDIEIPMPVDKAMDPDTLIALRMNDAPLPADHGAPARMIVPGWVGTYWVKWVGWLTVSAHEIRNYRTDEYYVIDETTVTRQNLKASLCLPFPAILPEGAHKLTGFARSPDAVIETVEWSEDGQNWQEARIVTPNTKWGWVQFEFEWQAQAGQHNIHTRAWDANGQTQPVVAYHNEGTLLYNAIIPHPVTISALPPSHTP